jgi:hypothetical protein
MLSAQSGMDRNQLTSIEHLIADEEARSVAILLEVVHNSTVRI